MSDSDTILPRAGNYEMEYPLSLNIRDVWKDEARDFTPWLAHEKCINLLANAIGLEGIELTDAPKKESSPLYSRRRCDIEARVRADDGRLKTIVIENQLEETDFSHLGRIMLYAAQRAANYVIWVVPDASPDHRKVISWLNRVIQADVEFYLVKIEVFKVDNTHATPVFTLVEGPDLGQKIHDMGTPRQVKNYDFWAGFYDFVNEAKNREIVSCIKSFRQGSRDNWYDVAIGKSACHFALWNSNHQADISIVSNSKAIFDKLMTVKGEMARTINMPDERIILNADNTNPVVRFQGPAYHDKDRQNAYQWLADCIGKLTPIIRRVLDIKS